MAMTKKQITDFGMLHIINVSLLVASCFIARHSAGQNPLGKEVLTPVTHLTSVADRASELALHAIGLLGIRYKMGGTSPENGLDCSGLVRYVFKQAWNTDLPRTSEEISDVGQPVDSTNLQPGDLVFYNTLKRGFSHVGIYLGENRFIHSPSSGGEVRIENMNIDYWKKRFNGARRIVDPGEAEKDHSD